jgi:HEAT repeat protein
MDLWSAIDYLGRTGQGKKAVPYIEKFMDTKTTDETLVQIRERFGVGSVLRLADDPATLKYVEPLAARLADAARRYATQPERINRLITGLTGTREEQDFAVAGLREAGPDAVPPLVEALDRPRTTSEERSVLMRNLGRLDRSAVPPLLACLDSGNVGLQIAAATAVGQIGDPRAIPFLTYPASASEVAPAVRAAAQDAITRLTGRPFRADPKVAAQELTSAAWTYHRHQVDFPGNPVLVWVWAKDKKLPAAKSMQAHQAEDYFGQRLADEALRLQPNDVGARVAATSMDLQRAIDRVGLHEFSTKDHATYQQALATGPVVMTEVLRTALADGRDELAAVATMVLGKLTDRSKLASEGHPHPLVEALATPGAHGQFAAAKALVGLSPTVPFAGSSRVVPTLARFATSQRSPRAVVIDGNANRGSQLAGSLRTLGYETVLETAGDQGFQAATETADVELIMVSHTLSQGAWKLTDLLTNLKNDARTANLPVYVYGPLNLDIVRPYLLASYPKVKFLVQPVDARTLANLLGQRPTMLSSIERLNYAREAAELLARIAAQPKSPFAHDLSEVEPALAMALSLPESALAASVALGDIPDADAQRSLADSILDPARPLELRRSCANRLVHSIKRFGPLVAADQETQIAEDAQTEADRELQTGLKSVVAALRERVSRERRTIERTRSTGPSTSGLPAPARASNESP